MFQKRVFVRHKFPVWESSRIGAHIRSPISFEVSEVQSDVHYGKICFRFWRSCDVSELLGSIRLVRCASLIREQADFHRKFFAYHAKTCAHKQI